MSWTKRQLVTQALEELGMANYVFDMQSEDLQSALRRLDVMMAQWNSRGIRIGYPLTTSPENSDLDTETNVPDMAIEAIILNLALRLAPAYGVQLLRETKQIAKIAYSDLFNMYFKPDEMQFPNTLPAGQGNKSWRWNHNPFLRNPVDPLEPGSDSTFDFTDY